MDSTRDNEGDSALHFLADLFGILALCGCCGFCWQSEDGRPLRDQPDEKRQKTIERVKLAIVASAGGVRL